MREIRELADGYAFRLAEGPETLMQAAAFIDKERLCCPFFAFGLEVQGGRGPAWPRLPGPDGAKPFIRAELGDALGPGLARAHGFLG